MGVSQLAHYSIRTDDLAASERFYTDILGLRAGYRPPFDFPGLWLYAGEDESAFGVVHLIGTGESPDKLGSYLGTREPAGAGSGNIDHIAFLAHDWPAMRTRCEREKVRYALRCVPELGLLQIFMTDPSGITIELNYPAREAG